MKRLVNLLQWLVVLAIAYPVFYVWETTRIENFCGLVDPPISEQALQALAERRSINLPPHEPLDELGVQWKIRIEAYTSYKGYACEILGAENTVAKARIVKGQ